MRPVLAPASRPPDPTPQSGHSHSNDLEGTRDEEFEDELDLPQPSFSIALDDDVSSTNDFQEAPPRLSMPLEDGEQTVRSVELPRRAVGERSQSRFSRGSFGSTRASDRVSAMSELGSNEESQHGLDGSIVPSPFNVNIEELDIFNQESDTGLIRYHKGWLWRS